MSRESIENKLHFPICPLLGVYCCLLYCHSSWKIDSSTLLCNKAVYVGGTSFDTAWSFKGYKVNGRNTKLVFNIQYAYSCLSCQHNSLFRWFCTQYTNITKLHINHTYINLWIIYRLVCIYHMCVSYRAQACIQVILKQQKVGSCQHVRCICKYSCPSHKPYIKTPLLFNRVLVVCMSPTLVCY